MYMKTEIMFPAYAIPALRDAAGAEWRRLIDKVTALEETHPDSLALSLMMIRLDGCLECETDSFRAMRGCVACALQTVRRYKNDESELLRLYKEARKEVGEYLKQAQRGKRAALSGSTPRSTKAALRRANA